MNFSPTLVVSDNKNCRYWLKQLLPSVSILPSRLLASIHFVDVDLVLLSGTEDWLARHILTVPDIPILCSLDFIPNPPARNLFGLRWFKFAHAAVGGVTDGYWFFGTSLPFPANCHLPPTYHRPLRSILSATVTPVTAADQPSSPDATFEVATYVSGILHLGGLLPVSHASSVRVCCPSVFTPTRWCIRRLTVFELSTAFDLPAHFSAVFKSAFAGPTQQLPFLGSAPSKLLRTIFVTFGFPSLSIPGGVLSGVRSGDPSQPPIEVTLDVSNVATAAVTTATDNFAGENEDLWRLLDHGDKSGLADNRQKAAKNDDAPVPTILWDRLLWQNDIWSPKVWHQAATFLALRQSNPLDILRNSFFLPIWRKNIWRSWRAFYRKRRSSHDYPMEEEAADREGAAECLHYAARCSWWEWTGGSKLFFWRWPEDIRNLARDGMPTWITGDLPAYRVPQRREKDPHTREMMADKAANVVGKGYVGPGRVLSLTSYFSVPKGEGDIRMVYDLTKCGLNAVIWVPSFSLPDVDSLLDLVEECSWMADIDIGEMFLNFPLDKFLQPYCGVDFSPFLPHLVSWLRWLRCAMGLKPSPYVAIRFLLLGSEIIRGRNTDSKNALRYDEVRLNLPGMINYNPRLPWVSKIISSTQRIAADYVGYVDDLRPVGSSEAVCNQCARQVSCRLGYLGIQDASRKRQGASKASGVWAGAVVFANEDGVGVNCTQEKWDKTKGYLLSIHEVISGSDLINHKMLERIRGFLLYVTKTYPAMVPFLKGIHLTLDSWRPGRDSDGWRLTMSEMLARGADKEGVEEDFAVLHAKGAPEFVTPSTRLEDDIATLRRLTSAESPPKRFIRSRLIATACYGFGDASGSGFGSTIEVAEGLRYRHGLWGRDMNNRSSNYRELRNLVEAIEEGVSDGSLEGCELFLFTDNTVAEAAFYKGNTSSSKVLFELIVRLRLLEMSGSIKLWVIHVAGRRMIQQGADGLSRGNLLEGVMAGVPMLSFVPLSTSAIERSPDLPGWLSTWCPLKPQILEAADWYCKGHGITGGFYNAENIWIPTSTSSGIFVWHPPPAAARSAVEQLSIARHKRPCLTHVFVCPRLFTSLWRKKLYKLADCVVYIPAGSRTFWPETMFEPLILGLILPFSSTSPWQHRRTPKVLEMEGQLRKVWAKPDGSEQPLLRKFFEL